MLGKLNVRYLRESQIYLNTLLKGIIEILFATKRQKKEQEKTKSRELKLAVLTRLTSELYFNNKT